MELDGETDDFWVDEESLHFSNVPAALWSDSLTDVVPGQPETHGLTNLWMKLKSRDCLKWVFCKSDAITLEKSMVLSQPGFVYDWRLKTFENRINENGIPIKKWM